MIQGQLLPGVPADYVTARLAAAAGQEVESGKFFSPESSAALAVNCFGWFHERPGLLPPLPGLDAGQAKSVEVEFCARFPWSGGKHPWLDAAITTASTLIGVESKRYEPFRDKKTLDLRPAYDRPVWGANMGGYQAMRDRLRSGEEHFAYLDAAQLVKHALGILTQAGKRGLTGALFYIYAEPKARNQKTISPTQHASHRAEIERFSAAVKGNAVEFRSSSYREWLGTWPTDDGKLSAHADALIRRFGL